MSRRERKEMDAVKKGVRTILALMLMATLLTAAVPVALADGQEMVTICHAAGLEGTTQYVTLTIAHPAVFGEAGHFYENGTPRAGHEQDYLGECKEESTTTSVDTTTTSVDTTITVADSTTSTVADTTTTLQTTTTSVAATTTEQSTTTVTLAPSSTISDPTTTTSSAAELPFTGIDSGWLGLGFSMLVLGILLVLSARRGIER